MAGDPGVNGVAVRYNAHILGTAGIGDDIKVTISTTQCLYSQLTNNVLTVAND